MNLYGKRVHESIWYKASEIILIFSEGPVRISNWLKQSLFVPKKCILSNFRAQGSLHVSQLNQIWYSIKFSVFLQILYLFKLPTIKSYTLTLSPR